MKTKTITITHKLTPQNSQILDGMLEGVVKSLSSFWNNKSKKSFKIELK